MNDGVTLLVLAGRCFVLIGCLNIYRWLRGGLGFLPSTTPTQMSRFFLLRTGPQNSSFLTRSLKLRYYMLSDHHTYCSVNCTIQFFVRSILRASKLWPV
jgi:hypothetical protein